MQNPDLYVKKLCICKYVFTDIFVSALYPSLSLEFKKCTGKPVIKSQDKCSCLLQLSLLRAFRRFK